MNSVVAELYQRAWLFASVEASADSAVSADELAKRYQRDTNAMLNGAERAFLHATLPATACAVFGGEIRDDGTVVGIKFRELEFASGKRVLYAASNTVLSLDSGFNHKGGLATRGTVNAQIACSFSCEYCSTAAVMWRNRQYDIIRLLNLDPRNVLLRRLNPSDTLRRQLTDEHGLPRFKSPDDDGIVEISSLVDCLANNQAFAETVELVQLLLDLTNWRIRILTKSALLKKFARRFAAYKDRLLLGLSIGIPDDDIAGVVERGTSRPSTRLRIHRELLAEGYQMFGMPSPVLPVTDYRALAERIAEQIDPDRLEAVWAEVINRRGDSIVRTIAALRRGGFISEADRLAHVNRSEITWELEYNRAAFLGFREIIPPHKLRYLTYTTDDTADWWQQHASDGAVLL